MASMLRAVATLALILCAACEPKPLAELPALDGRKRPDNTDRELPTPATVAPLLALLDPRVGDPAQLDMRRINFIDGLRALVPDEKRQEELGFTRVLFWHQDFTRQLGAHRRSLAAYEKRLHDLLMPPKGFTVRFAADGEARLCRKREPKPVVVAPPPPSKPKIQWERFEGKWRMKRVKAHEPPPPVAPPPPAPARPRCEKVMGLLQLQEEAEALDAEVAGLFEAEWYLVTHIDRLRARLDPEGMRESPAEPGVPAP